jgi:hypothetical protein
MKHRKWLLSFWQGPNSGSCFGPYESRPHPHHIYLIYFNLFFQSTPTSSKWSIFLMLSHQKRACSSVFSTYLQRVQSTHPRWFKDTNHNRRHKAPNAILSRLLLFSAREGNVMEWVLFLWPADPTFLQLRQWEQQRPQRIKIVSVRSVKYKNICLSLFSRAVDWS